MPRPLSEQTVVITGASSGIGREAAILMGKRGANLVLAARDEAALKEVAAEVERGGGHALVVPTDVAEWPAVERLAAAAVENFGRIDTWVNDAGIGVVGPVADAEVAELDRLIRVNLMGMIHGVKAALPHMQAQRGGAFINIGSVAGVRSFPLQATYSATKHAVKGFTEALRLELQHLEPGEFHVTYIAPAAINTPFFNDARTKFDTEAAPPPPVYEPEVVAESIVFAAENPRRDIFVGGGGKLFDILQRISPPLVDWLMTRGDMIFKEQVSDRPSGPDNLFTPPGHPRTVHGTHDAKANSTSLYTKVFEWHPALKPIALGALALGALALVRAASAPKHRGPFHRS